MRLDEVAAAIVAEVSPEEAEYFPAIAQAVRRDPARAFGPGRDEPLAFGLAEAVALLTPIVLGALSAAATNTLTTFVETAAKGTSKRVRGFLRRKRAPEIAPPETVLDLTPEQVKEVTQAVERIAVSIGVEETVALRLRQALFGHLSGER
ncbi:hypothetical protein GT755_02530 [Herbidospora sp. NEAU-GS84]|uniref:Uncharacterized protein n=1 Tax=Herbidospora solisilvae TaxID=2696284 RepID=A0A7C9NYE8_9ACTN|nr:hypothetical protein [Herbidospora solisilvae]NAS20557.1 hypothetical protein [Herbidospora solisilvae]